MAQATLQEMAREVHLYSSEVCPILLAQRWIRDRFRKVCEKSIWSFKLGRGAFCTVDSYLTLGYSGTITLTSGSATVTGSGTNFLSPLVGQQLKTGGYVFTVLSVASTTSLTIDQTWLGDTITTQNFDVMQCYITPSANGGPTDFHAFYSVIDPSLAWIIRLNYNVKELDRIDARRSATGTPRVLANGVYSTSGGINAGTEVYELWPNGATSRQYMYTYERRIADLTPSDTPPPIIRSDVLVTGALADLARWPGTPERKNPMFDPYFTQWKLRELEFSQEVQKLIVEDQSIFQTDLTFANSMLNAAPLDAKFMQNHAYGAF